MKGKRKEPQQDLPGLIMIITFGVAIVAFASVLLYMLARQSHFRHDLTSRAVPPFFGSVAAAQPLPATLDPSNFKDLAVEGAYSIARKKPAMLAHQPCYCGCSRQGHRSLLDCFKDQHAAGCSICIHEATYANDLDTRGKCAADIRDAITRTDWKHLEESQ